MARAVTNPPGRRGALKHIGGLKSPPVPCYQKNQGGSKMTVENRIERARSDIIKVRNNVPNSKANVKIVDALLKAEKSITNAQELIIDYNQSHGF